MKKALAKISSVATVTVATISGVLVESVSAQDSPLSWINGVGGTSSTSLPAFVQKIINWAIGLTAVVAVVMLIAAGFMYITANGDENKIKKATTTLTFAIVGLVVAFIAVLLVTFVLNDILSVGTK